RTPCSLFQIRYHDRVGAGGFRQRNLLARFHQERRDIDPAALDEHVAVAHELTRLCAAAGDAEAVNQGIEATLEQLQQDGAGYAAVTVGNAEVPAELALEDAVNALGLLLLAKLLTIGRQLLAILAMLTGRVVLALDGALRGHAPRALQKQFF